MNTPTTEPETAPDPDRVTVIAPPPAGWPRGASCYAYRGRLWDYVALAGIFRAEARYGKDGISRALEEAGHE